MNLWSVRKVIAHRADKASGLTTVVLVSCEVTEKSNDIVDLEKTLVHGEHKQHPCKD